MKNIGLSTCFLDNYGACLQAYALSSSITDMGMNCEIINYTEPTGYFKNSLLEKIKESWLYNKARGLIQPEYLVSYKLEKIRRKAFRNFRKTHLNIGKTEFSSYQKLKDAKLNYDAFVCGSDQIWNPTFYNKCNPAYYLNFVPDDIPKIAYAPSIGISKIPEEYVSDFKKYVNRFDFVSVREEQGAKLISENTDKCAEVVLDPTLLLTGERWSSIASKRLVKKPYIFCYLFGNSKKYRETIEYLSKKTNLDIVIIPFNDWNLDKNYKKIYKAEPFDFLSLIKNAEYIFTDSFHASVFSILFGKRFYTALRHSKNDPNSMNSRIFNLLSICELQERCLDDDNYKSFDLDLLIDYNETYQILSKMRQKSLDFLKNALEV